MFDVAGLAAVLTGWSTIRFAAACMKGFETYIRGIDFSPGGSYFVITTTGRASSPDRLCDTASRWETNATGVRNPIWVNHTGGDFFYAVAVTGNAVYLGGHQRWLNNPQGHESAGLGAVSRVGIGVVDSNTGWALVWNLIRSRGTGVRAFVVMRYGLIVGLDIMQLGCEFYGWLGMFSLA